MRIQSPILLFGMPRSGTTWLGKIFDSHPTTVYRHEPDSFQPLADVPLLARPADYAVYHARLQRYLVEVMQMQAESVCAKQPIFPKDYTAAASTGLFRLGAMLSKAAARLGVALPVLGAPNLPGTADARLVWKSIESLGRLGLFLAVYEDARAIQILRHPCGYVASVLRGEASQRFTNSGAAEDWGIFSMLCETDQARRRGLNLEVLRTLTQVERLAWRWLLFNEKATDDTRASGRCMSVYYEELCHDPQRVTRAMFDFCGLSWSAATDAFLQQSTSREKSDYYSVFKDPLQSAWKWRAQLGPQEIEQILRIAGRSPLAAGYVSPSEWNVAVQRS